MITTMQPTKQRNQKKEKVIIDQCHEQRKSQHTLLDN